MRFIQREIVIFDGWLPSFPSSSPCQISIHLYYLLLGNFSCPHSLRPTSSSVHVTLFQVQAKSINTQTDSEGSSVSQNQVSTQTKPTDYSNPSKTSVSNQRQLNLSRVKHLYLRFANMHDPRCSTPSLSSNFNANSRCKRISESYRIRRFTNRNLVWLEKPSRLWVDPLNKKSSHIKGGSAAI